MRLIATGVWRFPSFGFLTPFSMYVPRISRYGAAPKSRFSRDKIWEPSTPTLFVSLGGQLMIGFGIPDSRSLEVAPESATFWGTFDAVAGVVSIICLRADDRPVCISLVEPLFRPTDLPSVHQLGHQFCEDRDGGFTTHSARLYFRSWNAVKMCGFLGARPSIARRHQTGECRRVNTSCS